MADVTVVRRGTTEREGHLVVEEANYTFTNATGTRSTDAPSGSLGEMAGRATSACTFGLPCIRCICLML